MKKTKSNEISYSDSDGIFFYLVLFCGALVYKINNVHYCNNEIKKLNKKIVRMKKEMKNLEEFILNHIL